MASAPGLDLSVDELMSRRDPRLRMEALVQAKRRAIGGEPLDMDLLEAGFFGNRPEVSADLALAIRSLGDYLTRLRDQSNDRRWAADENTLLNFAFKNGHHYVEVDRARRSVVPIPAPQGLIRRKIDKMKPWYRSQHSRLAQAKPRLGAHPKSSQQLDKDAAKFADELREWLEDVIFSHPKRSAVTMWGLMSGMAVHWLEVEWDTEAEFMVDEQGEPLARPEIVHEILSPMEVWCDDRRSRVEDMRWIGRDRYVVEAEARAMYGSLDEQQVMDHGGAIEPSERGYQVLREVQQMLGREDPWTNQDQRIIDPGSGEENELILPEFWAEPGFTMQGEFVEGLAEHPSLQVEVVRRTDQGGPGVIRFPDGVRIVMTISGFVLEITENFLGELPAREVGLEESPGFWRTAWASPLRELNKAIDFAYSLREEHMVKTGRPTWLEPEQAKVHDRASGQSGRFRMRYRANRFGAKPEYAKPPNAPVDIIQWVQELNVLWDDIAGLHEVSRGKLPAKLSGVGISLLQESDLQQLGFGGSEIESAAKEIMKRSIRYVQQFFPEGDPRLLEIAGDTPYRLAAFMQADVEDGLDIRVQEGSAMPRSQAETEAKVAQLWEMGALVDELGRPDFRRVKMAFGLGTEDELYAEEEVDQQNARLEEEQILNMDPDQALMILEGFQMGIPLPDLVAPQDFENAVVHERSHRMRLKTEETNPRVNRINFKLLELHWIMTLEIAAPVLGQADPMAILPLFGAAQQMGAGEEEAEGQTAEGAEESGSNDTEAA